MAEALAHGAEVNWVNVEENKATPLIQAVRGVWDTHTWRGRRGRGIIGIFLCHCSFWTACFANEWSCDAEVVFTMCNFLFPVNAWELYNLVVFQFGMEANPFCFLSHMTWCWEGRMGLALILEIWCWIVFLLWFCRGRWLLVNSYCRTGPMWTSGTWKEEDPCTMPRFWDTLGNSLLQNLSTASLYYNCSREAS